MSYTEGELHSKQIRDSINSLLETVGSDEIGKLIESLAGKDFATQTTLQEVVNVIELVGTGNVADGTATGGTTTSLADTSQNWTADMWAGAYASITVNSTTYVREVSSNTSDTISWTDTLDVEVSVGDEYEIKVRSDTVNITDRTAGEEGNAWDNELTGAGGDSNAVDAQFVSVVDIAGEVSGATDITLYKSQDGTKFYNSGIVIEITEAEDFAVNDLPVGFRYLRLQSSNDVTATATIAAKM